MAPEQISGRPVDGRCDVYSLACVVYETLAGAPPFQRDDDMALLWAHQYDPPPPLTAQRPDLPAAVDDVLAKALAKTPDDRYDSLPAVRRRAARGGAGRTRAGGHPPTQVDLRVGQAGRTRAAAAPPRWARAGVPRARRPVL